MLQDFAEFKEYSDALDKLPTRTIWAVKSAGFIYRCFNTKVEALTYMLEYNKRVIKSRECKIEPVTFIDANNHQRVASYEAADLIK